MTTTNIINSLISGGKNDVVSISGVSKVLADKKNSSYNFSESDFSNMLSGRNNSSNLSKNDDGFKFTNSSQEDYKTYRYNDNKISVADIETNDVKVKFEENEETVADTVKKIANVFIEKLDVSEEELETALANLGFSLAQLLDTKQLSTIVAEITDLSDISELVVDSGFQSLMIEVNQIVSEFCEEIDIESEGFDLQEIVSLMQESNEDITDLQKENSSMLEEIDTVIVEENNVEVIASNTEQKNSNLTVESDLATNEAIETGDFTGIIVDSNSNKTKDEANENLSNMNQEAEKEILLKDEALNVDADNDFVRKIDSSEDATNKSEKISEDAVLSEATENANGIDDKISTRNKMQNSIHTGMDTNGIRFNVEGNGSVENAGVTEPVSYVSFETKDIISQIVTSAKIEMNLDTTTMEMQLNPENLGKIYLNISTKAGAVNATITATNEAVKEALEAQIVDLKDNLNQAGVKVDAVEVTVASHEFERNLEQNQTREEQQAMEHEKNNKRRRNIEITSLDDLSGLMSEEEALAAQIMRENGNTIDFTA